LLSRLLDSLFAALFGTIQRMLFWELLRVFVLCLFALAGVFTLLAVLQQIQGGASLGQALRMLPLLVPTSVPWITPPACLFASCVVYGRLANDQEAVALKAAGVDLLGTLRPALALGLIAAALTAYLQFDVTPQSWRGSREVLVEDPEEAIGLVLKRKQTLEFPSGTSVVKLSVRDVQDTHLKDVVVKQRKASSGWDDPELVARTRAAVLKVDTAARKVRLELEGDGRWESRTRDAQGAGSSHPDRPTEMDLPAQFDLDDLRAENANNPAMVDWIHLPGTADRARVARDWHREVASRLDALPASVLPDDEVAGFAARLYEWARGGDRVADMPPDRQVEWERKWLDRRVVPEADPAKRARQKTDHDNRTKAFDRIDRIMRYEYYLRPAIAFGCLLFAVLGCPVGLWANRADYLSIFVICFLPALLVYYPVLFMVGGYARDGKLPMAVGVWAANGVLALGAVILSWRLIRR
jgi:lipopolysaccharide export system permease protein